MIYVHQYFTNDDFSTFFLVSVNTLLKSPKYMQIIFILIWIGQIIRERSCMKIMLTFYFSSFVSVLTI